MKTTRLEIQGMTCGHCVEAVRGALAGTEGVRAATVDLQAGSAEVEYDESLVSTDALIAAVEEEGYQAATA